MPRPAPRVAPATTATLPRRGFIATPSVISSPRRDPAGHRTGRPSTRRTPGRTSSRGPRPGRCSPARAGIATWTRSARRSGTPAPRPDPPAPTPPPRLPPPAGGGPQRRHAPADVDRRLRADEVRALLRPLPPVRLGHAEVVEQRLR